MTVRRAAKGQAMIETLVGMLLIAPLLFAVLELSARQGAQQAAQSAAWAGAVAAHHGLDLRDVGGALRSEFRRIELTQQGMAVPGAAATSEDFAFALLQPARLVGTGRLDLAPARVRRMSAVVGVSEQPQAGEWTEPPVYTERADLAVLVDDWGAPDVATVWRRTAALSTAGRLDAWRSTLQWASAPMQLLEPAVGRLCLGRIDPDIVPMDRLPGLRAESVDLRVRRC